MNKRVVVFLLLASSLTAFSAPKPKHRPTPAPTPTPINGIVKKAGMVCRTDQEDAELRDWINGLMNETHKAQADLSAALKSNTDTQAKLDASQRDATALANECAADKQCAHAPLSCWFHRLMKHLLWIGGGIALLVIGLLVASIFVPALGPVLSFFVSIWKWILGLFTRKSP